MKNLLKKNYIYGILVLLVIEIPSIIFLGLLLLLAKLLPFLAYNLS